MGLMDSLRKAEEQGRDKAHTMLHRALAKGGELERTLRQRMPLYPGGKSAGSQTNTMNAAPSEVSQAAPVGVSAPDLYGEQTKHMEVVNPAQHKPRPIVSVNGQDVPTVHSTPNDMKCEKDTA